MKTFLLAKFALIPFAVFCALLAADRPDWAVWSALALLVAGNLRRTIRSEFAGLETGGLALFVLIGHAQILSPEWTAANALWLLFAGLGVISLASVALGRPWTADYSRAARSQLARLNAGLTGFWGMLFLLVACYERLGVSGWISAATLIFGAAVATSGPPLASAFWPRLLSVKRKSISWLAPVSQLHPPVPEVRAKEDALV